MTFLFSSQVKKELREFFDIIFFLNLLGVLLSLVSVYHWFFNLFDQFLHVYLYVSLFLMFIFLILKAFPQIFASLCLSMFCALSFYNTNVKVVNSDLNSKFNIYYQNINSSNVKLEALPLAIQNTNSEIVALVESTVAAEERFLNLNEYTKKLSLPRDDNYGFLILGKINFQVNEIYEKFGIPVYVRIYIEKYNLRMYLVHLPPPLWKDAWKIQQDTLKKIVNEINLDRPQAFMIVGDLNMVATSNQFKNFYKEFSSPPYSQELFNPGTWPSFMPAYIRLPIDHVLSNKKFSLKLKDSFGSDHKGFVIQVAN